MSSNRSPEIWKTIDHIEDLKGLYDVSSHGRVYSHHTGRVLRGYMSRGTSPGYWRHTFVGHSKKRYAIETQRLMGPMYLPNPDGKPTVDHADGVKTNNHIENLRWATKKEQAENRDFRGLRKLTMTEVRQLRLDWEKGRWKSIAEAARHHDISKEACRLILRGRTYVETPWARPAIKD